MRILFICHRFPYPPARGGKIRPFNIIRHLQREHDVTVASLIRSAQEEREGRGLAAHCSRILAEPISTPAALARMVSRLPTLAPSSMGYFHSPRLARRIRQEIQRTRFDLIFVHCAFMAPYAADVQGPRKLLDFGDMDSQKWLTYARVRSFPLSAGYYLDGVKLRRAEARLAKRFHMCTCTTRAEMDTLAGYRVDVPLGWFPNGVDVEYFKPTGKPYDPEQITFTGRMDYYPNQEGMIDFCHTVLPALRARRSGVKLTIVGANPSSAVRKLAALPGVTVTGSVPDVRPFLESGAVAVAPLRIARGTQNKILEAMAMGVPVVAHTAAMGGVDAVPGRDLLAASAPQEFVETLLRLLADRGERMRFAAAGRARILSHHTWPRSMDALDRIIGGVMAGEGQTAARPA